MCTRIECMQTRWSLQILVVAVMYTYYNFLRYFIRTKYENEIQLRCDFVVGVEFARPPAGDVNKSHVALAILPSSTRTFSPSPIKTLPVRSNCIVPVGFERFGYNNNNNIRTGVLKIRKFLSVYIRPIGLTWYIYVRFGDIWFA